MQPGNASLNTLGHMILAKIQMGSNLLEHGIRNANVQILQAALVFAEGNAMGRPSVQTVEDGSQFGSQSFYQRRICHQSIQIGL